MKRITGFVLAGALLLLGGRGISVARADEAPKEPTKEGVEFFEKNIRPVLSESCYNCHSVQAKANKKLKSKFYADSLEGMTKGGESGEPGITPGDPDKSSVVKAIRYQYTGDDESKNMPPKTKKDGKGGKLSPEVIANFEKWVKDGAQVPADFQKPKTAAGPAAPGQDVQSSAAADPKSFWSFQPPRELQAPAVGRADAVKNDIDRFIISKLEAKGLTLSPAADRRTLIRRATFSLTGLPPTPAEADAFICDKSPDAWEKVVDRLLASPRYGERWARHWLDVARYSDTKGYVFQEERRYPFAYTYRDWVINAFNTDLPYDQFLIQQIAADQLQTSGALKGDNRPLAAMGFLTVGRRFLNSIPDIIDDRIDVVCRGTMGLTVACARCHDHKFDPIPTKDYYSLYGIFASSTEPKDLPVIATTVPTPASLAFEKGLKAREAAADAFVQQKSTEILLGMRTAKSLATYLLAAQAGKPESGEESAAELSRHMVRRWKDYLARAASADDAIFAPWRAYAALPADRFVAEAPHVVEKLNAARGARPANPAVLEALTAKPPASLEDVAARYGDVLLKFDGDHPLPDVAQEALRLVLRGPDAPLSVPPAELPRLFKRDSRDKLIELKRQADAFVATSPDAPGRAMVVVDTPDPHDFPVLVRGNAGNPGPVTPRHFLSVIAGAQPEHWTQGSGRLQLARAIASRDNPLTARVMVNRIWLQHFGRGIVRTPSDFGTRSDPPSHPELLDYLAIRFMNDGWSMKKLQKLILMSAAYQQGSDGNEHAAAVDPENLLLWRQNRQRLDFEATRDSLLFVSGKLDETAGGRPVDIEDAGNVRRSVYAFIDRQNLPSTFRAFDFASPDAHSPQRFTTTVPQQALFFINSPFLMNQAKSLTTRPEVAQQKDAGERARQLYRLLYARDPSAEEVSLAQQFIATEESALPASPIWQYGFGRYDETAKRVVSFELLPHFTGTTWQGGPKAPDPKLVYALLTDAGGHAGRDAAHAVVRRWTAPTDAIVNISGALAHGNPKGDGVRGRIVSSRDGLLGEWLVHNSNADASVAGVHVQAGDMFDFVVDCRGGDTFDSFTWAPVVRTVDGTGVWSAKGDFAGSSKKDAGKLSSWEKYAQILLDANEFVFVD